MNKHLDETQHTRGIETLLSKCWSTAYDAGPTLRQQCIMIRSLEGELQRLLCTKRSFMTPGAAVIASQLLERNNYFTVKLDVLSSDLLDHSFSFARTGCDILRVYSKGDFRQ